MSADYIYEDTRKQVRIRIFRRGSQWDFDVGDMATGDIENCCGESGESYFHTKKEALEFAKTQYGPLKSINPKGRWL